MTKMPNQRKRFQFLEQLESRQLMAVDTAVANGLLTISGASDGAVEVAATVDSKIEVTDNGVSIGVFDSVKSINITIDAGGTANNTVTLKLEGLPVDRVMANLGGGDNSLALTSGSIKGSLYLTGGSGKDSLDLAAGTTVGRNVYAKLGNGANTLTDSGSITGSLIVSGGVDAETISILATATIGNSLFAELGNGANSLDVAGTVQKNVAAKTGSGDDTVNIGSSAFIGESVNACLGSGSNTLTHSGEIAGDLRVASKTSTDTVTVAADAIVGGKTIERLGIRVGSHREHFRSGGSNSAGIGASFLRGRR